MSIHRFPNKPLRDPARELGLSDIPLPAAYAMRDMSRANDRFYHAISLEAHARTMSPSVAKQARADVEKYGDVIRLKDIGGIAVVENDDIVKFIHRVTGHPHAWVLSWQLHAFAGTLSGQEIDRESSETAFSYHVAEALEVFSRGYNREI